MKVAIFIPTLGSSLFIEISIYHSRSTHAQFATNIEVTDIFVIIVNKFELNSRNRSADTARVVVFGVWEISTDTSSFSHSEDLGEWSAFGQELLETMLWAFFERSGTTSGVLDALQRILVFEIRIDDGKHHWGYGGTISDFMLFDGLQVWLKLETTHDVGWNAVVERREMGTRCSSNMEHRCGDKSSLLVI